MSDFRGTTKVLLWEELGSGHLVSALWFTGQRSIICCSRAAGRFNQEYRAGQRKGLPYPILWIAEYFTIDGEGIRWGRFYLQAGYYAHILVWWALFQNSNFRNFEFWIQAGVPTVDPDHGAVLYGDVVRRLFLTLNGNRPYHGKHPLRHNTKSQSADDPLRRCETDIHLGMVVLAVPHQWWATINQ